MFRRHLALWEPVIDHRLSGRSAARARNRPRLWAGEIYQGKIKEMIKPERRLHSCGIGKTDAEFGPAPKINRPISDEGAPMIKVSVMYPNTAGARFDHAYYKDKHMPLVKARMGDACKSYTIDKGLGGGAPGAPATYVGMCHIFCDSVEAFQSGFGPHAKEIMGDITNYTDIAPVMQISEVVVG
jgi:uncharacterized protein (TIGR02118 family)